MKAWGVMAAKVPCLRAWPVKGITEVRNGCSYVESPPHFLMVDAGRTIYSYRYTITPARRRRYRKELCLCQITRRKLRI